MDRRIFLKTMGLGSAAFLLTSVRPRLGTAAPMGDRRFVFCYFNGGWDIQMGLDPRRWTDTYAGVELGWDNVNWTTSLGLEASDVSGMKDLDGILRPRGSNIDFGPAFAPVFGADGSDSTYSALYERGCVIRGMSMDTLTHEVGRRFFLTGRVPAGSRAVGSSIPALLVGQLEPEALPPLPNLAVNMETYAEGLPFFANATRVNSNSDLLRLLRRDGYALSGDVASALQRYRRSARLDDPDRLDRVGLLGLVRASQEDAEEILGQQINDYFTNANLESAGVGFRRNISSELQAAIAYQAITQNVAQCVSVQLAAGLDTHFDNNWELDQPRNQSRGWLALAKLVKSLQDSDYGDGSSWLDHTTIVCFSEFSRTSQLNSRGGRDHNLVNAAMMVGAGVPQNKVVGESDMDTMNPQRINPDTGAVVGGDEGIMLSPTKVLSSVMDNAGFDTTALRHEEIGVLKA